MSDPTSHKPVANFITLRTGPSRGLRVRVALATVGVVILFAAYIGAAVALAMALTPDNPSCPSKCGDALRE